LPIELGIKVATSGCQVGKAWFSGQANNEVVHNRQHLCLLAIGHVGRIFG
jgi:hypothetical protein